MKHFLIFACLFLCLGLGSCQCSDKPDVGPVEGGGQAVVLPAPAGASQRAA